MVDREKVIKGLEEMIDYFFDIYRNDTDSYKCAKAQEYSDCAIDAIALLKEQEAKPQRYEENDIFHLPLCPREHCNALIKKEWHYCPYCKQPIQWDDDLAEKVNMEGR